MTGDAGRSGRWLDGMREEPFTSWASTFDELDERQCDTALFTIGAVEQHSYHLPLGTDWLLGMVISRLLARELSRRGMPVYVLPTIPIGTSSEHLTFRGTLSLKPATVAAILQDVVACLKRQGFKRLIVVSTHGGNWILKPALRELNMWDPDFLVMWSRPVGGGGSGPGADRHAGEGETAAMLHCFPELVRPGRAEDASPDLGSEFVDMIPMEYLTPSGVWGFPGKADAARGARHLQESAARQAEYIVHTVRRLDELRAARDGAARHAAENGAAHAARARPPQVRSARRRP